MNQRGSSNFSLKVEFPSVGIVSGLKKKRIMNLGSVLRFRLTVVYSNVCQFSPFFATEFDG